MSEFYKDVTVAVIFLSGLFGFVSGEFIISSAFFAIAAVASNVNLNSKRSKAERLSCK